MSIPKVLRHSKHPFLTFVGILAGLTFLGFLFTKPIQEEKKTDSEVKFYYDGNPLCQKVDRDWIDVIKKRPKKSSVFMKKDIPIYKRIRNSWPDYVGGIWSQCFVSLDPTTISGRFLQQVFDFYGSHSTDCQFKVRLGGLDDGGKWLCDIVPCNKCLIYSLGSGEQFEFEKAAKQYYGCDIHTFDCTTTGAKTPDSINFHQWCLGSKDELLDGKQFFSLTTIMKMLNHTHIDLLKMDIERYEYMIVETLQTVSKDFLPKQIAFEVHTNPMNGFEEYVTFEQFEQLWERLHGMGYKVIAYNVNPADQCCWDFTLLRDEDEAST